jgi:hypothetical protein
MGVKFTRRLTRTEAEEKFIELYVRKKSEARRAEMKPRIEALGSDVRVNVRDVDLDHLSDDTFVEIFYHVDIVLRKAEWVINARVMVALLSLGSLEDALEELNDSLSDNNEGGENYFITLTREENTMAEETCTPEKLIELLDKNDLLSSHEGQHRLFIPGSGALYIDDLKVIVAEIERRNASGK